ncbi:hypothetical protein GCM10022221_54130 [Actinocorallia aurea]
MEFATEFALAADADTAWQALLDVRRVAPLMPGVVLESTSDAEHHGRAKIKFGATTITYKGTARTAVVDDLTRTAILEASAREARGPGTAEAVFQATVLPSPSGCRVLLHIRASFTGRAASLPDPVIRDAATKLLTRFATALSATLTTPAPTPAPEATDEPSGAATAPCTVPEAPEAVEALGIPEVDKASEAVEVEQAPVVSETFEVEVAEPVGAEPVGAEPVGAVHGTGLGGAGGPGAGGGRTGGGLRRVLPVVAMVLAVLVAVRVVARRRAG